MRLGYRHVDTAELYENEREVGEGFRASGAKRNDVFVTTKIWPSHFAPRELERAARDCLVRLRLSEVDLLLLHWPNPQIPLPDTIGALCKVKRDGLARHIGVSNFTVSLIDEALAASSEPLVCNQIECHPFLDQSKVIKACSAHGMAVVAYSPIARGDARGNAVLTRIGAAHKKSAVQAACAFWCSTASSSSRAPARSSGLSENAAIFDFELSKQEMTEIAGLAHPGRQGGGLGVFRPAEVGLTVVVRGGGRPSNHERIGMKLALADTGSPPELVIGPATSGRTRWRA